MIGRLASADPITEAPFSTQGWNRYAYVGNSPVNFTDPSGYCFMGCFWNSAFRGLGALLRKHPIIGTVLRIAAMALCAGAGPACAPIAAFLSSAFVAGVTSGSLGAVQNQTYEYDLIGKLMQRTEANTGLSETFGYDPLNRMINASVNQTISKLYSYSPTGNMFLPGPADSRSRCSARTIGARGNGITNHYTSYDQPWYIGRGKPFSFFTPLRR